MALTPSPMARWVLPIPGGPSRTTFSALGTNVLVARCASTSRRREGRWSRLKSSRVLTGREVRGADPHGGALGLAVGDLPLQHRGEVLLVGPVLVAGLVGDLLPAPSDRGGLEDPGQVGHLRGQPLSRCLVGVGSASSFPWWSAHVVTSPRWLGSKVTPNRAS